GWVAETFAALEAVFDPKTLATLKTPVLVMSGSKEMVVDPSGIYDWVRQASEKAQGKIRYRVINGAKHELLSEIDRFYLPALAAIKDWFNDFLRPQGSRD